MNEKRDRNRPIPIHYHACVASTNDTAFQMVADGYTLPFAVMAGKQTQGRGRRGHCFFSPEGGFYFTYACRPALHLAPGQLTCLAAVAAAGAIASSLGFTVGVKWINDLVYDGRKAGGVLCEQKGQALLLIGIGINIAAADFPPELETSAGSLFDVLPEPDPRERLALALAETLTALLDTPIEAVMNWYRSLLIVLNRRVRVRSGKMEGAIIIPRDVDAAGRLLAESADGTALVLDDGDISLALEDIP